MPETSRPTSCYFRRSGNCFTYRSMVTIQSGSKNEATTFEGSHLLTPSRSFGILQRRFVL